MLGDTVNMSGRKFCVPGDLPIAEIGGGSPGRLVNGQARQTWECTTAERLRADDGSCLFLMPWEQHQV